MKKGKKFEYCIKETSQIICFYRRKEYKQYKLLGEQG